MEKILVTGAGGFAGGYIARYLLADGYDVTGVLHTKGEACSFPVVVADLADTIHLTEHFDVIIHAAGSLPFKEQDFRQFKRNNIDAMENILTFAKRTSVKRIIFLSTIGVYGEFRDEIIDESADRINPDAYGVTKYVAECLLHAEPEIESISLRMPGIIGKGSRGVWLPDTVEKFRRNEEVKIYSPDFQTKNFVWIGDLAKFIRKLTQMEGWKYNVVNLACQQSASVREIVTEIKKLTKSTSPLLVDDSLRQPFCLSNQRAQHMGYESIEPLDIVRRYISELERK